MLAGATVKRNLRSGRSLWSDSKGLGLAPRPLLGLVVADVAIIGAGVSGAFMAEQLSRDFEVVILDRRAPMMGSTIASTAMLQWELDKPLIALADEIGHARARRVYRRSYAAVRDLVGLVREQRIACDLRVKRSLYLAGDAYGSRALAAEAEARAQMGLPSTFLHAKDVRDRFGLHRTGAIVSNDCASADPGRLAAGLIRRSKQRGARIFSPVEVTDVVKDNGRLTLINNTGFEVSARQVVFCCGYEFPKIVPTHGAHIISTWAVASAPLKNAPAWLAKYLVWEASDPYLYFRTTPDGRLVIGGEDEQSSTRHDDPNALRRKPKRILDKLTALAPNLDAAVDYAWSGAFGQSTTSMPLIGAIPGLPNGYAVMGLGGNGITFSVIASQIIGHAVRGSVDPDWDLYRF